MKIFKNIFTLGLILGSLSFYAQCDNEKSVCDNHLTSEYISDGQTYKAMLFGDQIAQFDVTLFEGSTYRIAGASGSNDGNLLITLFDEMGNELFSNKDHLNSPYWDFVLESTMNVTIEAKLDQNKLDSGCAVLLIGFKR